MLLLMNADNVRLLSKSQILITLLFDRQLPALGAKALLHQPGSSQWRPDLPGTEPRS